MLLPDEQQALIGSGSRYSLEVFISSGIGCLGCWDSSYLGSTGYWLRYQLFHPPFKA